MSTPEGLSNLQSQRLAAPNKTSMVYEWDHSRRMAHRLERRIIDTTRLDSESGFSERNVTSLSLNCIRQTNHSLRPAIHRYFYLIKASCRQLVCRQALTYLTYSQRYDSGEWGKMRYRTRCSSTPSRRSRGHSRHVPCNEAFYLLSTILTKHDVLLHL